MSEEFKQLIANLKDFLLCADLEYRERDAIQSIEYQISEYVDGLESALARLREERRWIPVEEDLPKFHSVVWGCSRRNEVDECYLDENGDWYIDDFYKKRIDVIYWKEIKKPEPPEEE